jgi:hypothetical protein
MIAIKFPQIILFEGIGSRNKACMAAADRGLVAAADAAWVWL